MKGYWAVPILASILILGVLGLSQDPFAQAIQGNISGTVDDVDDATLLLGIEVSILNADNAVLSATSFTDASGFYDSGGIPDGDYKVRFSDPGVFAPGFYVPVFFSAGGIDSFDSGSTVSVVSDSTTTVNESMKFSGPSLVVTGTGTIFGTVSDAADSSLLGGIQVSFFNGENAVLISTATTDANGDYNSGTLTVFVTDKVKVRFSDPADIYLPEYFSRTSDTDSFSSGFSITFFGATHVVNETMVKKGTISPSELIDSIEDLGLPSNVENSLKAPLKNAQDKLNDDNPKNDGAACGKMDAFINMVNAQEGKKLTTDQADDLREAAQSVKDSIGC